MLHDAWRAVAELAASQHGAFTRAQAAERGIESRRLATAVRAARVAQVTPAVFVFTGRSRSPRQGLMVATLGLTGAMASHRGGAHLHRFDGFETPFKEVSVPAGGRGVPPLPGTVVHRLKSLPDKRDIVSVDGIRCTGVARTLADLGAVVSSDAVLRALIGLRAKGVNLGWLHTTALRVNAPGTNGARVLLRLLDSWARAGSVPESWLEEVLRRILEHPALPPLQSQFVLRDRAGRFVARFDHAFPSVRLAIEGHSRKYHFGPVHEAADEDRDMRVAREGWETLYLGWYSQRRPERVVADIAEVIAHRTIRSA